VLAPNTHDQLRLEIGLAARSRRPSALRSRFLLPFGEVALELVDQYQPRARAKGSPTRTVKNP
jgi:hypothetical protein